MLIPDPTSDLRQGVVDILNQDIEVDLSPGELYQSDEQAWELRVSPHAQTPLPVCNITEDGGSPPPDNKDNIGS